jgi:ABC-type transport system involved in cytochrome c biogenesis permease subunit
MEPPSWTLMLYRGAMVHGVIFTVVALLRRKWATAQKLGVVELFAWVGVVWGVRMAVTGHFPIFGAYESALSLAFIGGLTLFILSLIHKRPYMAFYPAVVFLLLLHGNRYSPAVWALTISERSVWVHLHALAAYIAFGFALGLLAASLLIYLRQEAPLRQLLLWFFLYYTLALALGSFYRFQLFGRAWSFDPMETMNLACYLGFATLVHLAYFRNWEARRLAGWTLFCVLLLVLAYRLILIFPASSTYHLLDIDLRLHLLPK